MAIILPLPKDRTLLFNKEVDQTSIGELSKSILEINVDDSYITQLYKLHGLLYTPEPIKIYIDSYGGDIYQCLGIIGIIENSKTPIHTITTGCALSSGFLIAIAGHKRFSYNKATFMYHQISHESLEATLKDQTDDIIETKRLQDIVEKFVCKNTKITIKQLKKSYTEKNDWYMTSKEALKLGVIDKII
jgi:ATP-dependent Clp protease protease subunit